MELCGYNLEPSINRTVDQPCWRPAVRCLPLSGLWLQPYSPVRSGVFRFHLPSLLSFPPRVVARTSLVRPPTTHLLSLPFSAKRQLSTWITIISAHDGPPSGRSDEHTTVVKIKKLIVHSTSLSHIGQVCTQNTNVSGSDTHRGYVTPGHRFNPEPLVHTGRR
ncbi:hypothetical protein CBL_07139 [Carabus blaptoides fortunei]